MTLETFATAEVFDPGLQVVREKVDALNKRAARHGMNTLEVRVVGIKTFVPIYGGRADRPFRTGHAQNLYRIEIAGHAPRINGWALAARVEFNDTIGNVVRIAPGRDDDGSYSAYRTIGPVCEHCNSRRRRNDIFVLEDEAGRRKVVGRNCLADFLRCDGADSFARLAEYADLANQIVRDADAGEGDYDGYGGGSDRVRIMPLERYLPVVAMLMRRIGWTSRTACREDEGRTSTADYAYRYIFAKDRYTRDWIESEELYADDEDADLAGRAVEWAKTVCTDGNEYLDTINRIALSGSVDFKGLDGYAASIIIAYRKACEREALRAEKAKGAKDKVWFGEAGRREKGIRVTCKGTHTFEGYYGVTTIVRFEHHVNDNEVAVLAWFASGDKERDWDVDTDYDIDAMIKGHDDDERYGKQTKINRVKGRKV
jgi:hypothetical protein